MDVHTGSGKLDVQDGFWKGVTVQNLSEVFASEEKRDPVPAFLADYTHLFGKSFVCAKKNIKPFLQEWARHDVQIDEHDVIQEIVVKDMESPNERHTNERPRVDMPVQPRKSVGAISAPSVRSDISLGDPEMTESDASHRMGNRPAMRPKYPSGDMLTLRRCLVHTGAPV